MVVMAAGGGGRGGGATAAGLGFYGFANAAAIAAGAGAAARAKACDSGGCSAVAGILFGVDRSRDTSGNESRAGRCHRSG